ncbi:MAG: NOG1 family protein [Candidatus Thorarchaeota archaeon]
MPKENPFSDIQTILPAEKLVEVVFRKSMKSMGSGGIDGVSPLILSRRLESKRVQECAKGFKDKLEIIIKQFPNLDEIPPFYQEMVELLVGKDNLRKILGSFQGIIYQLWKIQREHKSKIWNGTIKEAKKERKAAFSRFKSVILQTDSRLDHIRDLVVNLKKLPAIDFDNIRIVVAGFPNVGKSTFLKAITNANPEIANYPFTTKDVLIGHYQGTDKFNYLNVQVIDTPGLLDRSIEERNNIEKRAIAALKTLPSVILFLFESGGEDINKQINLFLELKKQFNQIAILPIINKIDLIDDNMLNLITNNIESKIHEKIFASLTMKNIEESNFLMKNILTFLQYG